MRKKQNEEVSEVIEGLELVKGMGSEGQEPLSRTLKTG